jgi:uncharacterized repeat protein (TIGR03803 family)
MNTCDHRKRINRFLRMASIATLFCACMAFYAQAQTFSLFYGFNQYSTDGSDGYYMKMIQATDGNFYGTMANGGAGAVNCNSYVDCGGVLFKITPSGDFTLLYTFCSLGDGKGDCPDGRSPYGGVMQASDGNFYGMTFAGGTYNDGTIFRFTPAGVLTTLHSFCYPPNTCNPIDGSAPTGQLIQASNGALYGVTTGATLFKMTLKGKFTLLYNFGAGYPQGTLVQLPSGTLYGVTQSGGAYGKGSVFKATLAGKVTTMYSFCSQGGSCLDGSQPFGGLALGNDGNLYGATFVGGTDGYGTIFKIAPTGKYKFAQLHQFTGFQNGGIDGTNPTAPLVLASDGNLYGTTQGGGGGGYGGTGSVYQVANGAYSNIYGIPTTGCIGQNPWAGLLQSTNGSLYGSNMGIFGCNGNSTLFEFSMGLGEFVAPIPTFGKAGTKVIIQGTDLTGASGVTFNGKPAAFTVVSATEITTTVPSGATTGTVEVVTPGGTLSSNVPFTVK